MNLGFETPTMKIFHNLLLVASANVSKHFDNTKSESDPFEQKYTFRGFFSILFL